MKQPTGMRLASTAAASLSTNCFQGNKMKKRGKKKEKEKMSTGPLGENDSISIT